MIRPALIFALLGALAPLSVSAGADAEEEALLRLAETATESAVRIRGLTPLRPVTTRVTTRTSVEDYVVERLESTGMSRELDITAQTFGHFGALPPGTDLPGVLRRVLRDQVAGYYDWIQETLFIADWLPSFLQLPTLVHEVTHALQDQHHDLGRFMEPNPGYSEASAAISALIEGDATLVMLGDVLVDADAGDGQLARLAKRSKVALLTRMMRHEVEEEPSLQSVPDVLRTLLIFPYVEGLNLAGMVHAEGGWEAIDELYRNPPLSTEQVLHVEKLIQLPRDHPLELHLPKIIAPGIEPLGSDTLGELGIREILATQLPRDQAASAAAGWGGDRYVLMGRSARSPTPAQRWVSAEWTGPNTEGLLRGLEPTSLCWIAEMDSEQDALELEEALGALRTPPAHLARASARVVVGWGHPAVLPADSCHVLLEDTRAERVTHYRWYAGRLPSASPPAP